MGNNANDVLNVARSQIGYSRWSDPQKGTKYGRWYASKFGSYFGENGVPYCAMFASWVFDQAGASCVGLPGAYCPTMLNAAKAAGKTVNKYAAKPGDVVYFDWGWDGVSDHVGIIEQNNGSYCTTIEGNTDNGQVLRKTRSWGTICGVVRPNYGSSSGSTPAPAPKPAPSPSTGNKYTKQGQEYLKNGGFSLGPDGVDGEFGPNTRAACIKFVQTQMNSLGQGLDVDGENGPLTKAAWNRLGMVYAGHGYPRCIKAVQVALLCRGYSVGSYGIDGDCGPDTTAAIKAFQRDNGLEVDGVVGPMTFAKLF